MSDNNASEMERRQIKKPFNKRKWREQRYSTKVKVQQWENRKRISAVRRLQKELKHEGLGQKLSLSFKKNQDQGLSAYKRAQLEYKNKQEEKQRKIAEQKRKQEEKEAALAKYKQKKAIKFEKLNRKTKKGQPVMKGRIELLLEKIQKQYSSS